MNSRGRNALVHLITAERTALSAIGKVVGQTCLHPVNGLLGARVAPSGFLHDSRVE
jgi:hypothetical protein